MERISLESLLTKDIRGKVICFPTDTVYGVGALINDEEGISKIYKLKHRDPSKALAILSPTKDIKAYVKKIHPYAQILMDKYWPGALTLIFEKSSLISEELTRGLSTVAFRVPNSEITLKILSKFGPLATTSVNLSGEEAINNPKIIYEKFYEEIDYLVTDEAKLSLKASRVIDVSGTEEKLIRN